MLSVSGHWQLKDPGLGGKAALLTLRPLPTAPDLSLGSRAAQVLGLVLPFHSFQATLQSKRFGKVELILSFNTNYVRKTRITCT